MRIAVVGGCPPNPEGEAHYTWCVVRELAVLSSEPVTLLAHRPTKAPWNEPIADNLVIHRVTWGYHPLRRHLAFLHLKRWCDRIQPHVVHFQGPHKGLYGGVYGEPLLLLFRYLRRVGIPTVITLHSLWFREDFQLMAEERNLHAWKLRLLERHYYWYHLHLMRAANQVNALVSGDSNPLIGEFLREWCLDSAVICSEPHPCQPKVLSCQQVHSTKESLGLSNKRIVLAFGFVRPDKGFDYLIKAMAPILRSDSRAMLLIAGEPRGRLGNMYANQLQALCHELEVGSQVLLELEYLPESRLHLYLQAADIVVIPYTRVMGASGPMHHALSYGKPVVASRVGQNRGMEEVCLLVPPRNVESLQEALTALLYETRTWETYHERSLNYAQSHTWQHLAHRYLKDYQNIIRS